MEIKSERNRVFMEDENGEVAAEVTFPACGEHIVEIDHTFVKPGLRGKNVASDLMQAAYDEIKAQGKKARLSCPYAIKWFDRNERARDIVVSSAKQPGAV